MEKIEEVRKEAMKRVDGNSIRARFETVLEATIQHQFDTALADLPSGTLLEQAKNLSKCKIGDYGQDPLLKYIKQKDDHSKQNSFNSSENPKREKKSHLGKKFKELDNEKARDYLHQLSKRKTLKEIAVTLGYDPATSTGPSALSKFINKKTVNSKNIVDKLNRKIKEKGELFP